ncbi:MAG: hypothetical protein JRI97_05705 [Deltaproteobacteria bacterium]|nr:hypothetical protein [Deltaproteobacteria bacterium]
MNDYRADHAHAHALVRNWLEQASRAERDRLLEQAAPYLSFRREVDAYTGKYFSAHCTAACFTDQKSACCSRDGILTWFADHVVNGLLSGPEGVDSLLARLENPPPGRRCVYLSGSGCAWTLSPLVCAMFLCAPAKEEVFSGNPSAKAEWEALKVREKAFTWPDRPVLFEAMEALFIGRGHTSPLMHIHRSPGLLMVKKRAGRT